MAIAEAATLRFMKLRRLVIIALSEFFERPESNG